MGRKFRVFAVLFITMLVVSIGFNISLALTNGTAEPGSDQDPLISKSYVDQVVGQLSQKLLTMQGQLDQLVQKTNAQDTTIKALQNELSAVKNQTPTTPASSTSTNTPSNGNGNGSVGGAATTVTLKGTVTAAALNVRAQANTTSAIVAKAYKGEVLTVVTKGAVWSSVKTAKGVAGYVQTQYLSIK